MVWDNPTLFKRFIFLATTCINGVMLNKALTSEGPVCAGHSLGDAHAQSKSLLSLSSPHLRHDDSPYVNSHLTAQPRFTEWASGLDLIRVSDSFYVQYKAWP